MNTLSHRQAHYLYLLSEGLSRAEIAAKMGCTSNAVRQCLNEVYEKLGANSAPHAVRIGFEMGVLASPGGRSELERVYRALAVANARPLVRETAATHPFGDYLLRTGAVA